MFVNRYSHLSLEEREKLFASRESGKSLRIIARELGRSVGTVSRELKRNAKYGRPYIPCRADRLAFKRGFIQRWKAPLKNASTAKLKLNMGVDEAWRFAQANYVPATEL